MFRSIIALALPVGLGGLLFALSPTVVSAAGPPVNEEREQVDRVNKAISRGVQYLRASYNKNTQWDQTWLNMLADMDGGVTALATLALLNSGAKPTDPEVAEALKYLRRQPLKKTYVVALSTMAYAEARDPIDKPRVAENAKWLIQTAIRGDKGKITGWSYPFGPGGRPDGSNTQYALLGLYAAKQYGAENIDDETWRQIRQLYVDTQVKIGADSGYWRYVTSGEMSEPRFTMTVAGVCGLIIAGMGLNESQQQLNPLTGVAAKCGLYGTTEPVDRGMNWIGQHFSYGKGRAGESDFYNIYGIERVGRLSGQRFLGKTDWYRDGCKILVDKQLDDGSWGSSRGGGGVDSGVIATSFALLFLSKGRSPVLISKLAYGDFLMSADDRVLTERGDDPGVVGWNRKHSDARHLTEFASKQLFNGLPLSWQVYDPRRREYKKDEDILAEVGVLVQSPIVYFNGHKRPVLKGQHKEILKKYVEEGGFILAEACCGSEEFAAGFRDLMRDLFPDTPLRTMPPEHAIWTSFFAVPPTEFRKLECMDRGCRTVVVFSPEPLAGYWEETKYMPVKGKPDTNRGETAFRLGANVIAYATGMEPPQQRLTMRKILDPNKIDRSPPKGYVKPAQLIIPGESPPAPNAMRTLMAHLQSAARMDVVLDKEALDARSEDLFKYKFVYMHGRKRFTFSDDEIANLKAHVLSGGLLFADACCGKPEFDEAFRAMVGKMFPDQKLRLIESNDELYSDKLNGTAITTVKRREKTDGAGADGGFKELPPYLEGIMVDGRWAIIYSKYDIGCSLEGHRSTDCLGHTRESALKLATAAMLYALKR
ncbi:DUF4159 domain-containing protein [Fimbriiglobus ruber]|uniref:DUF4159 domain-containing protein n=1 Tax=Fimbriiglobus ruber TaxID=1908690 RepID=A0A225E5T1_9BACT|nr:DUF4159 domain-containing protein [Fimbriiglobus ruber]OWK43787.1 hypothetical protein FRUB_03386 [Fimbriiglobus ruber]